MAQHYYTLEEAAKILQTTPDKVREMVLQGKLYGFRDGGTYRFRARDLEEITGSPIASESVATPPKKKGPLEQAEEQIAHSLQTGYSSIELNFGLTTVPESLRRCSFVTELSLAHNQLVSLPDWLAEFPKLEVLYLHDNQLSELPESFGRMPVLRELTLSRNHFTAVPAALKRLRQLRRLFLNRNRLESLPVWLAQLPHLEELGLHGNDALGLPPEILGTVDEPDSLSVILTDFDDLEPTRPKDILEYYFRTQNISRPLNQAKVILLGRGEVGKTSLVKRLVENRFDASEPITHGIKITQWNVKLRGDDITLHVWDFGGQEIMHATHQFFLTERALYLIVLNGRQGQEDTDAEYWLQLVRSFGADSPVIVVLNKVGQYPFDLNRNALLARYPNIKGFIRTDCADCTGLDQLNRAMAREIDRLPSLRAKFPAGWFAIKDRLAKMTENYLTFERYTEICADAGETDPAAQEQLAGFLHALGVALNYRDDPRLNDKHVLNPHWITGGIYALLTSSRLETQNGILHPADLATILDAREYPRSMHRFLLDLMRKFDVCFALPDDSGRYLVPGLLGKQQPGEVSRFEPTRCLHFEYRYAVLPEGLLARFIARTHWHSTNQPRWRTGVILGFDGGEALVTADALARRISVRVLGPAERRRSLLAMIRNELDRIHTDFKGDPPEAWVPIPGHPSEAVSYRELCDFEQAGEQTLIRSLGGKVVRLSVPDLLDGIDLDGARQRHPQRRVRLFVSYAHRDETHKATLGGHLLPLIQEGLIHWWDDRHLRPGDDWAGDIDRNLEQADVILLLVSRHFLASRYCTTIEVPRALERQNAGQSLVVPIILDGSDTSGQAFMNRQVLPTDNRPILEPRHWPDPNDGWRQVVGALREVVRNRLVE